MKEATRKKCQEIALAKRISKTRKRKRLKGFSEPEIDEYFSNKRPMPESKKIRFCSCGKRYSQLLLVEVCKKSHNGGRRDN